MREKAVGFFPQISGVFPQVLIVLELVKISGMGYASVVCLVGKRSTFSKYTESAMMHRPWFRGQALPEPRSLRTVVMTESLSYLCFVDNKLSQKDGQSVEVFMTYVVL